MSPNARVEEVQKLNERGIQKVGQGGARWRVEDVSKWAWSSFGGYKLVSKNKRHTDAETGTFSGYHISNGSNRQGTVPMMINNWTTVHLNRLTQLMTGLTVRTAVRDKKEGKRNPINTPKTTKRKNINRGKIHLRLLYTKSASQPRTYQTRS